MADGDRQTLHELLTEVVPLDERLATALRALVDAYEYDLLVRLFEEAREA